ncbi:GNAT family N-acetyltransferase [Clostridium sp. D2Q-14]|uniref:GNAT family N-acetyltransferase n=1 Tax=Anaeromonas gelatinilytica TaxID=2683194 RepID=UPI00193B061B|nr:GNAT family N-acetyltransferase [Anaeromonas gelatinilytica]MBS4535706.1 GNAT family N-acetyltransferase [Anaeromonas gelatinilytica]
MDLVSNRVMLKSLSLEGLMQISKQNKFIYEGIDLTSLVLTDIQRRAINIKIGKMKKAKRELHDWYTYWLIINKDSLDTMGLIGFKGIDNKGEAEIGYGISKQYEGQGYMTEAVKILIEWAFKSRLCKTLTATGVLKTNYGSQNVLLKKWI